MVASGREVEAMKKLLGRRQQEVGAKAWAAFGLAPAQLWMAIAM